MRLLFLILCASAYYTGNAQKILNEEHNHDHHRNEIAAGYSPIYLLNDNEFATGIHVHFTRNLIHSGLGIGFGYERIFENDHSNLGIILSYRVKDHLTVGLSPGVNWEDDNIYRFALHLEGSYEFELRDFHLGPVAEYAFDSEHHHISLGIHIGYGF